MAGQDKDRTFHGADSGYSFPNDSFEHDRLDEQSRAITKMIGGNHFLTDIEALARDSSCFNALDIGCGTGVLTTFLAKDAQSSTTGNVKVYGIDLSPVPPLHDRPECVEYIEGDINDLIGRDVRLRPSGFNFITHRMLVLGICDWNRYVRHIFSLLKPGARVELQDTSLRWLDINGEEISHGWKWSSVLHKATKRLGFDILGPESLQRTLIDNGFVDVEERVYRWPCTDVDWENNPDSGDIGRYTVHTLRNTFPLGLMRMAQRAGLDETRDLEGLSNYEELKEDYTATLSGLGKGAHSKFYVVTGRKPSG